MAVTIDREGRKPCFSSQILSNFLGAKKCWLSPGKNTVKSWLHIWSICICCSWPTPSFGFKQAELDSKLRSKHPRSGNIFGTPRWPGTSQQIRPPPYRNWKPAALFMWHLPMSGKDRQGAPIDHLCLHFTGGKTHLKSESTPYTYRSGGPNGHLAIWTCKVHLASCMEITSCLSFRFSARKTWGMHTIMVARDGYMAMGR